MTQLGELYGIMLSEPRVTNMISRDKLTLRGGDKELFWGRADDETFYYVKMQEGRFDMPADGDSEGRALVMADYAAYVPYAERGYEAFDGIVKELGFHSVAEWRFKKFLKSFGERASLVSEEAAAAVKAYFDDYMKEEWRADDIFDISRAICRALHRVEACYKTAKAVDIDDIDVADMLIDMFADGGVIKADDFLAQFPSPDPLSPEQLDYLKRLAEEV